MAVLRHTERKDGKTTALDMKETLDEAGVVEQDAALRQAAGQAFYNASKFTLRDTAHPSQPGAARSRFPQLP